MSARMRIGERRAMTRAAIAALLGGPLAQDGDEYVIDGVVWRACEYESPELDATSFEYKVSPRGLAGDYDAGARFVDACDIEEAWPVGRALHAVERIGGAP